MPSLINGLFYAWPLWTAISLRTFTVLFFILKNKGLGTIVLVAFK
jgi:hypothetical protein